MIRKNERFFAIVEADAAEFFSGVEFFISAIDGYLGPYKIRIDEAVSLNERQCKLFFMVLEDYPIGLLDNNYKYLIEGATLHRSYSIVQVERQR